MIRWNPIPTQYVVAGDRVTIRNIGEYVVSDDQVADVDIVVDSYTMTGDVISTSGSSSPTILDNNTLQFNIISNIEEDYIYSDHKERIVLKATKDDDVALVLVKVRPFNITSEFDGGSPLDGEPGIQGLQEPMVIKGTKAIKGQKVIKDKKVIKGQMVILLQ